FRRDFDDNATCRRSHPLLAKEVPPMGLDLAHRNPARIHCVHEPPPLRSPPSQPFHLPPLSLLNPQPSLHRLNTRPSPDLHQPPNALSLILSRPHICSPPLPLHSRHLFSRNQRRLGGHQFPPCPLHLPLSPL